jgi:hypothetical protein
VIGAWCKTVVCCDYGTAGTITDWNVVLYIVGNWSEEKIEGWGTNRTDIQGSPTEHVRV